MSKPAESSPHQTSLFTPYERQHTLDRLLAALETDPRITGVIIVGSGAVGFEDGYSDIDLAVVVGAAEDLTPVFREWKGRVEELFNVLHYFETIYGPRSFLHGFLLQGFLEVDMGFVCLADLSAKRARWKVAFDRSGEIKDIMRSSWEQRPRPDVQALYLKRLNSIWYYITHTAIALERGRPWMALCHLEEIRNRAIELAGLREGLEIKHFRQADQMPAGLLDELGQTLSSAASDDVARALGAATTCFFRQAKELDQVLGLDVAGELEEKMQVYLNTVRTKPGA
jgi:hypothetical protein